MAEPGISSLRGPREFEERRDSALLKSGPAAEHPSISTLPKGLDAGLFVSVSSGHD
jgi:hypothetical protein